MNTKPFIKLVELTARTFYDDITIGDNHPKSARIDNRGIAVVVLDALTRHQWVREEDLAKNLKLHPNQLPRILRFFEQEKFITRDHSYCCLDYAQIYDVVRYRLHQMRKKLKDEVDNNKNTNQEYICQNCSRRYTALDACRLVSFEDEYLHCENCNGKLVAESDKLAGQEKHRKLQDKLEVELKPLMNQLIRVKDLQVPEFETLQAWEARANAFARRSNDCSAADPYESSLGYNVTSMPLLGEIKVEVTFSGVDDIDNASGEDNEEDDIEWEEG